MRRSPLGAVASAVILVWAGPSLSADVCNALERFAQEAEPVTALIDKAPAPVCGTSLAVSGVQSSHCYWAFDYRSDAARGGFLQVAAGVAACADPIAQEGDVNHPDSYDLRQFDLGGATVAVSLKDKGALQQTLVFLRVEARSP